MGVEMDSTETDDATQEERPTREERSPPNGESTRHARSTREGPIPEYVDWILGALITLAGMMGIVAGTMVAFVVDQELIAEAIEQEDVTVMIGTTELTGAEAIEIADAVTSWVGIGLLVIGVGLILFAIGYVIQRHRAHNRHQRGGPISSYSTHAVLGAVVTVLASFLPFSPAIGGGVAGYLERSESTRTISAGTLAGLLPAVPVVVFLLFLLAGLVSGLLAINQTAAATVVGTAVFFSAMIVATVGAVLGALGGFIGGRLAEEAN